MRKKFDVPLKISLLTKDKNAARQSVDAILDWPTQTIVMTHNSIIEKSAKALLEQAFKRF